MRFCIPYNEALYTILWLISYCTMRFFLYTMTHFLSYYDAFPIILWRISYCTMAHFLSTMAHFLSTMAHFLSYYGSFPIVLWLISYCIMCFSCHTISCFAIVGVPLSEFHTLIILRKPLLVFSPLTPSVAMAYPFK